MLINGQPYWVTAGGGPNVSAVSPLPIHGRNDTWANRYGSKDAIIP